MQNAIRQPTAEIKPAIERIQGKRSEDDDISATQKSNRLRRFIMFDRVEKVIEGKKQE